MSETQQRETELVVGTIGGITQKKADTWTVAVSPDGSQYAKNLWTKDADLVESLSTKLGQIGAFVCGASYWSKDGKQIRSLWITSADTNAPDGDGDGNAPPTVVGEFSNTAPLTAPSTPARAPAPQTKGGEMSKEEWARKDSAIHKMACIKTAADALKHTLPSDPSSDDLKRYIERVSILATGWHRSVIAERDDPTGSDVPF